MPWISSGANPRMSSRSASLRALKPASIRILVSSAVTSTALPPLPLPRTATLTELRPPVSPRRLAGFRGSVPRPLEDATGPRRHRDVPPGHGALGTLEELVEAVIGQVRAGAPAEGRHERRWHAASEHVAARTDHRARVEHRPDAGLHVIAEEAADLHQARVDRTRRSPDCDRSVVVLEIRVGRERTQVDPQANERVSQIAVVRLVRVAEKDAVRHLTA